MLTQSDVSAQVKMVIKSRQVNPFATYIIKQIYIYFSIKSYETRSKTDFQ
ncbi:hypothetical protein FHS10_001918 [Mucilaginibacter dorajii]|nr:hypothetical protein [Mucilaginibacter dorajii]